MSALGCRTPATARPTKTSPSEPLYAGYVRDLDDLIRLTNASDQAYFVLGLLPTLPAVEIGGSTDASASGQRPISGEPKPGHQRPKGKAVRQPRVLAWRDCAACGVSFPTHVAWERFCSARCRSRVFEASKRARLRLERADAKAC